MLFPTVSHWAVRAPQIMIASQRSTAPPTCPPPRRNVSAAYRVLWFGHARGGPLKLPTPGFSIPVLLTGATQAPEQRWRLVGSLYEEARPTLESAAALLCLLAICTLHGPWRGFAALAAACIGVTCLRLTQRAAYQRAQARRGPPSPQTTSPVASPAEKTPEAWAAEFAAGACAMSLIWGAASLCVLLRDTDPRLLLLVLMAQAGWLGGGAVRNAASPAAVIGQSLCALLPTLAGLLMAAPGFVQFAIPFVLLQLVATLGVARFLGQQITTLMVSEQRLAGANTQLLRLSAHDSLTGIANRRGFDAAMQVEWARAAREAADISVLLIDVDHFAAYNQIYRSLAGDDCLRFIAGYLSDAVRRPTDLAARFGGAMFAAILPETSEAGACEVAERVRRAVQAAALSHAGSPLHVVTISIGVASMAPQPGSDWSVLITLADRALADVKRAGRNGVRGAAARLPVGSWHRRRRSRTVDDANGTIGASTGASAGPATGDPLAVAANESAIPRGLKILVLEDDQMVALLLEDLLGELGCKVIGPCNSPKSCIDLIERHAPQVALLDVHLGGGDCFEVAEALTERSIPFAFATGDGGLELPPAYADKPVLPKPFHLTTIISLVADLARQAATPGVGPKDSASDTPPDPMTS
jgi:diguanylate cyclase (GGDEF)-like protein